MKIMANHRHSWKSTVQFSVLILVIISQQVSCRSHNSNETLTACQHIRRSESRRAKALGDEGKRVRIPKCSRLGDFEPIQCSNDIGNTECWCVDEYGVEITGTRKDREEDVNCAAPSKCSASSCRMFCPAGFARDLSTGCPVCKCRDPCSGVTCPRGLACEPVEVKCKTEPCPPIPTCRKARSFVDLCPAGQPLAISGTVRPFLCGLEPGKPQCPPLYRCLVQSGNDYGVCCPASLKYEKPGTCPSPDKMDVMESAGVLCGPGCTHDLECNQMQKCCPTSGCGMNCQQPFNVTVCHQARLLSEILSVNEREGRGYVPQCDGPGGTFSNKQCSRNGLVCWCVDPSNGNKVKGTMGAANSVTCEGIEILVSRGRSLEQTSQCDQNICAAVCEYGFKHDHNGCPTCECSEPCEGFLCPMGSHCEVATDPKCTSGSGLCASEPVCKPNQVYSNPCEIGTPLVDNVTAEVMFCQEETTTTTAPVYQGRSFLDADIEETQGRAMSSIITCPMDYRCTKLHREPGNVCCPEPQETTVVEEKQQTMCEYLRDFTERMEGTEDGMSLAIISPNCDDAGMYLPVQCQTKMRKVPRLEQKKYLEQQNVRQMRKLLETASANTRSRRSSESLKLYRIDNDGNQNVGVDQILTYLRQTVADSLQTESRHAKVIDIEAIDAQSINEPVKPINKRPVAPKRPLKTPVDDMVEVEVEECWCVDGFGTEIPKSRGDNVTLATCQSLRQSLECLDLTCRMGCDYGFHLNPDTQCPSCECRDPCDNVQCPDNQECRTVEVSCDGEYCPPVPACLPRKPGQCPFLVPPGSDEGSDLNTCEYECRSDTHCEGNKRCCTNGCGTQCVEPQFKTACQHLQTIQLHQASELGVPPKQKYIAQCSADGSWSTVQCGPGNECWCVDELGNEKVGTRIVGDQPDCDVKTPKPECPALKCKPCENGFRLDAKGCRTCGCKDLCKNISCPGGEECQLVQVECIGLPCPKMPICVPLRDSVCMEGLPLKNNGREISCGPQNDADSCPSTHSCQISPLSNRGVCCRKTRDVCFESMETTCMKSDEKNGENVQKWRFSPRLNKCVTIKVPKAASTMCQSKNLFHSDTACQSVCPVLSQCERLKLKNSMAAKRAGGQANAFFQPRCNSETGSWSPVQCLGNGNITSLEGMGVCWCADKKGAPVKGSLTKGVEPKCNSRQARRKNDDKTDSENPVMEELIRQITYLTDDSNFIEDEIEESLLAKSSTSESLVAVTERIITMARSTDVLSEQINRRSDPQTRPTKMEASTTRCNALKTTASFNVACDTNGAFLPTQCNENVCWCVDAAGNQLPASTTFEKGTRSCQYTPVEAVEVEMLLQNPNKQNLDHLYDVLRRELADLLGRSPENFRVHENYDGNAVLKFDLTDDNKIDMAYAIEDAIRQNNLLLYNGFLQPDITRSGFMHRISVQLPVPQPASGIPENTFQTIIFIIATASAFLVSIFVVFVMLKRGKNRMKNVTYDSHKTGDKYLDYSSPIFVLSTNEKE